MSKKYTVNYFIKKFKAIPNCRWTTGSFYSRGLRHCAVGHCGYAGSGKFGPEAAALIALFKEASLDFVVNVNDGYSKQFLQSKPKARILAALEHIKNL